MVVFDEARVRPRGEVERGEGEDGISLFLVKGRPKGMTVAPLKTLDQTRRWSEVRFVGVKLDAGSLMGAADKAWPQLKRALEWATRIWLFYFAGTAAAVRSSATFHLPLALSSSPSIDLTG